MALFGLGKKNEEAMPTAPGSPIDQVMALKQRGMGNDQIIQELERQGYNSSQIFDALNQSSLSGSNPAIDQSQNFPPTQEDFSQGQFPPQQHIETQPAPPPQVDKDQIEEVAEAIIDEKWKEFEEDLKVLIGWKEKTESKVNKFEQEIADLSSSLNSLHKSIMGKVSEYDKNITNVGTEIKAMEKVFQKVLPSLTENVNKLERMAKSKPAIIKK
jgi:hypothetical protein